MQGEGVCGKGAGGRLLSQRATGKKMVSTSPSPWSQEPLLRQGIEHIRVFFVLFSLSTLLRDSKRNLQDWGYSSMVECLPSMLEALALASPDSLCVLRKQEELVQQVRKRLEEALMADMLAHVEELARDGEAPLDKACVDEDDDEEDDDEEEEPEPDQELERI
jgi:hypothetical protein